MNISVFERARICVPGLQRCAGLYDKSLEINIWMTRDGVERDGARAESLTAASSRKQITVEGMTESLSAFAEILTSRRPLRIEVPMRASRRSRSHSRCPS